MGRFLQYACSFILTRFNPSGNLYGGKYWGGKDGEGVIYKLATSGTGWIESVAYCFSVGTACNGCCGTVFRITP